MPKLSRITLLSTVYKITASIIRNKLENIYENVMGEYQCGFRRGKATTNQLSNLKLILEKLWEYNITLYHQFIDFKTAYDSIIRKEIWTALEELGVSEKLVKICRHMTENSKGRVAKTSEILEINKGVRQGDWHYSI